MSVRLENPSQYEYMLHDYSKQTNDIGQARYEEDGQYGRVVGFLTSDGQYAVTVQDLSDAGDALGLSLAHDIAVEANANLSGH